MRAPKGPGTYPQLRRVPKVVQYSHCMALSRPKAQRPRGIAKEKTHECVLSAEMLQDCPCRRPT